MSITGILFSAPSAKKKMVLQDPKGEGMNSLEVTGSRTLEIEDRVAKIEKYLNDLSLHRDSRRGLDGARGPQGEPGVSNTPGPKGDPGRDADITQVVELALKRVRVEFDEEHKMLAHVVHHALVTGGVLDESGKAVLIPGPKGDSVVGAKGDPGQDGVSVVGPRGRDAKIEIGSVSVGETASVSLREHEGVQFLDVVLPRGEKGDTGAAGQDGVSNTPGPVGERGNEGERGLPGEGMNKAEIISLVLDMKRRGSL